MYILTLNAVSQEDGKATQQRQKEPVTVTTEESQFTRKLKKTKKKRKENLSQAKQMFSH